MHTVKQQTFLYQNARCSYWTLGERKKPPLLLLPGFTGIHSDLLPLAHELSSDFYLIIPDFPGWGKSQRLDEALTITHYAQFLFAVLQEEHIEIISIAGHCMGTAIAIEFGYLFPKYIVSLFLIGIPYQDGMWSKKLFLHLADMSRSFPPFLRPLFFLWRSRVIGIPLSFFVLQFRTFRKKLRITMKNAFAQSKQNEMVIEENWISFIHFNYTKARRFLFPVHIIQGEKDILIPYTQGMKFYTLLKHATFDLIPDAGHLPPVETPGKVAKLIKKHLLPQLLIV